MTYRLGVLAYRLMQAFLRLSMRVFFRRVEVVGAEHVPADGAVVFCGNHPNSLLDPALIISFGGRVVHFAAKDVLFKSPFLRFFLDALGAVPIRRRKDHGGQSIDNSDAFTRLYDVLAAGGAMGIFPEGISHDEAQLARLKTGAARIAFGAMETHPGLVVRLVPVGLHYVHKKRFRSSVLIQLGEPIVLGSERHALWKAGERAEVSALTDELSLRLRSLTVNADDWESVRVLDAVRRLYQPRDILLEERVELARRFNSVYPSVRDEPEVRALFDRVRTYQDGLDDLGLTDRQLRADHGPWEVAGRVAEHLLLALVWLPLAGVGMVVHLPLLIAVRVSGPWLAPRKDVIATTKFVAGFLGIGCVYAGLLGLALWRGGVVAATVVALTMPLSGHATLRVLERWRAVRRAGNTLLRRLFFQREVFALRAERDHLEELVVAAVQRYKPADMEALFPREPDGGAP